MRAEKRERRKAGKSGKRKSICNSVESFLRVIYGNTDYVSHCQIDGCYFHTWGYAGEEINVYKNLSLELLVLKTINPLEVKVHQPFSPLTMGG